MNTDSTTTQTSQDGVHHSKPIPISTHHLRNRSASLSSDSTNSPTSPPPLTPNNFPNTRIPIASSSPILYFLAQSSPGKTPATFPFRGFVPPAVAEDDQAEDQTLSTHHARRASTAGRFQPQPPVLEPHHERGVNVLRRLSLSGRRLSPSELPQTGNRQSPPNSSPPPMSTMQPNRKPRRSATVADHTRPRRAPSPMGERILKGHFDGFN